MSCNALARRVVAALIAMVGLVGGGALARLPRPVYRAARRVLTAAAFTYVAAALMSLLDVARWIRVLRL